MLNPDRVRELMLDYLYDLLDEAEAEQVREFFAAHPEARAEAARVRALLEGAARFEFPTVQFTAPVASPAPAVVAPRPRHRWIGWAVAASVTLALGAYGLQYARVNRAVDRARRELEVARIELDQLARAQGKQLEDNLAGAREFSEQRDRATVDAIRAQQLEKKQSADGLELTMNVTGPAALVPNVLNAFHVSTRKQDTRELAPARLHIRLIDDQQKVVAEKKNVLSEGDYAFHLPANPDSRPGARFTLDVSASRDGNVLSKFRQQLSIAPPKYVTHLATDKPMYQPGQAIRFRSLTLDRTSYEFPQEDLQLVYSITDPTGRQHFQLAGMDRLVRDGSGGPPVTIADGRPVRGIGVGEFVLPGDSNTPGGEWTLSVREANGRFAEVRRPFLVENYSREQFEKKLEFEQRSYGPGDQVIANCRIVPTDPKDKLRPVAITATGANIDGTAIDVKPLGPIDAAGNVKLAMTLPRNIERGWATLWVSVGKAGNTETIQRPIPIALNRVAVNFYPEGGDLLAGVPNRVYFEVRTPQGDPVTFKGRLLDSKGAEVASLATFGLVNQPGSDQGHGLFQFVPNAKEQYSIRVDQPAGIAEPIPFTVHGGIRPDGIAMSVTRSILANGEPIQVELRTANGPRRVQVAAFRRDRLIDIRRADLGNEAATVVRLNSNDEIGGIVRITCYEETAAESGQVSLTPRAERLVFLRSNRETRYGVAFDRDAYSAGDAAVLSLTARDEQGRPAPGVAMMSVVDLSILAMADERTSRRLPTYYAMSGDVRNAADLEHADFLLGSHPRAVEALDLLLGVRGWRRFADQNQDLKSGVLARTIGGPDLFVGNGRTTAAAVESMKRRVENAERELELKKAADDAFAQINREKQDKIRTESLAEMDARRQVVAQRERDYQQARDQSEPFERANAFVGRTLLIVLAAAALILAVFFLTVTVVTRHPASVRQLSRGLISLGIGVLLVTAAGLFRPNIETDTQVGMIEIEGVERQPSTTDALQSKDAADPFKADMAKRKTEAGPKALVAPMAAMPANAPSDTPPPPPAVARVVSPKFAEGGGAALPTEEWMKDRPSRLRFARREMYRDNPMKEAGFAPLAKPGANLPALPGGPAARGASGLPKPAPDAGRGPGGGSPGGIPGRPTDKLLPAGNEPGGQVPGPAGFGPMGQQRPGGFGGPGAAERAGAQPGERMGPQAMRLGTSSPPLVYREFVAHSPGRDALIAPNVSGSVDSLYWNPALIFDANGKATVRFGVPAAGSFRVLISGCTLDGRLGEADQQLRVK